MVWQILVTTWRSPGQIDSSEKKIGYGLVLPKIIGSGRVLGLRQALAVKHLYENNTITDGGVAPRCSFAGPT